MIAEKKMEKNEVFLEALTIGVFGWDLRKKTNIPMRINADAIVFGQYPNEMCQNFL